MCAASSIAKGGTAPAISIPPRRPAIRASQPGSTNNRSKTTILRQISRLLAEKLGASPVTDGNHVDFYDCGAPAFDAMVEAIRQAKHHIHLEFFIFQATTLGRRIRDELVLKAREGVQVRFLYDAIGTRGLSYKFLKPLHDAGGQTSAFLSISIWRSPFANQHRNHRKILVVDGEVGFVGGLNIGDEYMGLVSCYGYCATRTFASAGPPSTICSASSSKTGTSPPTKTSAARMSRIISRPKPAAAPTPCKSSNPGRTRTTKRFAKSFSPSS